MPYAIVRQLPIVALLALALIVGVFLGAVPTQAGGSCVYTLATTVSGGGGSIGVSPANSFECPTGLYNAGATVTVIATADPGYTWDSWTGTDDNNSASTYVSMHSDRSIKATFRSNCYTLTTTVSGGGGQISVSPSSSGGCPQGQYAPGSTVTVVATANAGYAWSSWSGTDDNSSRSTYVTMNSDRAVKATFSSNCYMLTTTVSGDGGWIGVSPTNSSGCAQGRYTPVLLSPSSQRPTPGTCGTPGLAPTITPTGPRLSP